MTCQGLRDWSRREVSRWILFGLTGDSAATVRAPASDLSMIEVTAEDVAALRDEDLRALIGLLCEAELRQRNLPVAAVTWGGSQTAKDGGVDVRVSLAHGTSIEGFVPKANTILQVKKQDMPRGEILDEMRPQEIVRPVIAELARVSGAYVIVSSASKSDSALANRKAAMAEAVQGVEAAADLTLDFYDANRVATWVRDRAGLIPWVRSKIGKSIKGWQAYGDWSPRPKGAVGAYLYDNEARIKSGKDESDALSAIDGINRIRDSLRTAGSVVRLVGLSGVGKTRLAEALFEPTVGINNLDPSLAFYTDVGFEPDPPPVSLASDLIANRTRAILVIDNCPPDVHRRLSDVVGSAGSTLSVITIEYDIQEDQPEGTDVFVLDTSSLSLIEKLVTTRYPALSQVDCRTIAEFSGGNARIALALARTIEKAETESYRVCRRAYSLRGWVLWHDRVGIPLR